MMYRQDINGLRGLAVLTVVVSHYFPSYFQSGFVGVDIFFVISGYLITRIVLFDLQEEKFSFKEFYKKRIRRILPCLIITVVMVSIVGYLTLFPNEFSQLNFHATRALLFQLNFKLADEAGYFDTTIHSKPLMHLWSLSIEEQFYFFFPAFMLLIFKSNYRNVLVIILALASLSTSIMHPDFIVNYYSSLSRFWEILLGSAIALNNSNFKHASFLNLMGAPVLLASFLIITPEDKIPGLLLLLPTVGAALIILSPYSFINRRIFSSRPLNFFGDISYPLYLIHWPLLSFSYIFFNGMPSRWVRIEILLLSLLLAYLLNVLIERPIKSKNIDTLTTILLSAYIMSLIASILASNHAKPLNSNIDVINATEAINDWSFPDGLKDIHLFGQTFKQLQGSGPITVFIGDSHIEQYSSRIKKVYEGNAVIFMTSGGCIPISSVTEKSHQDCDVKRKAYMQYLQANRDKVKTIIVGACWSCYFLKSENNFNIDGKNLSENDGKELALARLKEMLGEFSKTSKVFLILDNPVSPLNSPNYYLKGQGRWNFERKNFIPQNISYLINKDEKKINNDLQLLAKSLGVDSIDPYNFLCSKNECFIRKDGQWIYRDADHLRSSWVYKNASYIDSTASKISN